MAIETLMSDQALLKEIGQRLARRRVELGFSQAQLARESGVSKRTVERVEAGESTQTTTLVRLLRSLQWLEALDAAIPAGGARPMDLLKLKGKERQRVSPKKRREPVGDEWSWGDEG